MLRYVAEVHIVHWDTKYGNFVNATKHNDGLAVLGVLVEVNTNIFHLEQKNRILTLVLNGRLISCKLETTLLSAISNNSRNSWMSDAPKPTSCPIPSQLPISFRTALQASTDTQGLWPTPGVTKTSSGRYSTPQSPFPKDRYYNLTEWLHSFEMDIDVIHIYSWPNSDSSPTTMAGSWLGTSVQLSTVTGELSFTIRHHDEWPDWFKIFNANFIGRCTDIVRI